MKRHSLDAVSLVFGLVFAGIGVLYLVGGIDVADLVTRFWPAALVMLGLAMLFSARRTDEVAVAPPPPAWTAPAPAPPVAPIPPGPPEATMAEPVAPIPPVPPEATMAEPEPEPTTIRESTE